MFVHRNAALTLVKRLELVLFIRSGSTLKEGEAGLRDRSSRPRHSPRRTPEAVQERIVLLRRERRCMRAIAAQTGVSVSTVSRVLRAAGLSRLADLEPKEPDNRYEHPIPGAMLHVDVKRLARFHAPGHRATNDRSQGRSNGAGWDFLFVAVDDHSRLALVGIYPDETKQSAADFLERALTRMEELGAPVRRVLTDNGRCFASDTAREGYQRRGCVHRRTRPYRPRTNGKAERFIQTLLREWAYAKTYNDSDERNRALGPWLRWYNLERKHSGIQGRAPIQRIPNVLRNDI